MEYFLMPLKKFADFNGRARRKEYWMFLLFYYIIYFVLTLLASALGNAGLILIVIYSLGMLIPMLSCAVRRMHDVGKSGWFILIPIYNLILALTAGEVGPNEYGPDPKGNGEIDLVDHIN
jgi:uncharacterized membrane protein YhaH (DUF805 family)